MTSFLDLAIDDKKSDRAQLYSEDNSLRQFEIRSVLLDAFRICVKNFWRNFFYMLIALVVFLAMAFVVYEMAIQANETWKTTNDGQYFFIMITYLAAVIIIMGVVTCYVGLVTAGLDLLLGRKPKIGTMLSMSLRKMRFIITASILILVISSLLEKVRSFESELSDVAMLVIIASLMANVPIILNENVGLIASIRRNYYLSKGLFLKLLGAWGVILLISIAAIYASYLAEVNNSKIYAPVIVMVGVMVIISLSASLITSLYVHLIRAKEGVDVHEISEVFE